MKKEEIKKYLDTDLEFNVNGRGAYFKSSICVVSNYMRNRIIDVYRIANRLVSITVENPDFSELRVNQFVKIGDKEYRINSLPFMDSTPPKSFFEMDTFAIDYTEDELMNKVAELLLRPHHYHSRLQVSHPLRLPILQL